MVVNTWVLEGLWPHPVGWGSLFISEMQPWSLQGSANAELVPNTWFCLCLCPESPHLRSLTLCLDGPFPAVLPNYFHSPHWKATEISQTLSVPMKAIFSGTMGIVSLLDQWSYSWSCGPCHLVFRWWLEVSLSWLILTFPGLRVLREHHSHVAIFAGPLIWYRALARFEALVHFILWDSPIR